MMYRIDISHLSHVERGQLRKNLMPYVWEIYDVSYSPPVIDIHWTSDEDFRNLFPNLVPHLKPH